MLPWGLGLIPSWGTKIPQAVLVWQKKRGGGSNDRGKERFPSTEKECEDYLVKLNILLKRIPRPGEGKRPQVTYMAWPRIGAQRY